MHSRSCSAFFIGVAVFLGGAGFAHADEVDTCVRAAEEGQPLRSAGKLQLARERFAVCAREVCPSAIRRDCRTWIEQLDTQLGSFLLYAEDDAGHTLIDVSVSLDGTAIRDRLDDNAISVEPGKHTVHAEAVGMQPLDYSFTIAAGDQRRRVALVFTRISRPDGPTNKGRSEVSTRPRWPWVLLGVGVVSTGVGIYLGVRASERVSEMRDTCAPHCSKSEVDDLRVRMIAGDVLAGAGVVMIGLSTWMLITASDSSNTATNAMGSRSRYGHSAAPNSLPLVPVFSTSMMGGVWQREF